MFIKQLYTNCLAEAAYYIESNGEAAIVDPIRETEPYLELAKSRNATIKYIFETHFHADFVSGHIDLAKATGAKIIFGPTAEAKFEFHQAFDGEIFQLGNIKIKAIHTPGHTPESTSYLLYDENGKEHAIFTGDALFVGDVGRPDLLDGVIISKEEQVATLYETLNNKIKTLPDDVIVYPGHGPGSMCGKSIGNEKQSTIGKEKRTNYALQEMTKEEFARLILDGQLPAPQYFVKNAIINRTGYENIDKVLERNVKALNVSEVEKEVANGALVIDTRPAEEFVKGFIPGSIQVGLDGSYAVWVGTLVDIKQRIVIVSNPGDERNAILRLARVGYENVAGYLEGGFKTWQNASKPIDTIENLTPEEFATRVNQSPNPHEVILDVRRLDEYNNGHVKNALIIPLRDLEKNLDKLDKNKTFLIHCAGGYRSVIAASMLKNKGYKNIANVLGGFDKIKQTNAPLELPVLA